METSDKTVKVRQKSKVFVDASSATFLLAPSSDSFSNG